MAPAEHSASLTLAVAPDGAGVRKALRRICDTLRSWGSSDDAIGSAEMVLAEVLNNILEHALAARDCGEISVTIVSGTSLVSVKVIDDGVAMPGETLPSGTAARNALDAGELPEGGFGWGLIRTLSQDLEYRHETGYNHLTFRLPVI